MASDLELGAEQYYSFLVYIVFLMFEQFSIVDSPSLRSIMKQFLVPGQRLRSGHGGNNIKSLTTRPGVMIYLSSTLQKKNFHKDKVVKQVKYALEEKRVQYFMDRHTATQRELLSHTLVVF